MEETLYELLNNCTVRVQVEGGHGTGFFVAPGMILTCAHVVSNAYKDNKPIVVTYRKNEFTVSPINSSEIFSDKYPDLALIRIELRNHPCVSLDTDADVFDEFYAYGYTFDHPEGESITVDCEGIVGGEQALLKLKEGQVKPGSSGSPLLNRRTGYVCGMMKLTRDRATDLGGAALPAKAILAFLPELGDQNHAFHKMHKRWESVRYQRREIVQTRSVVATVYTKPGSIERPKELIGRQDLITQINGLLENSRSVVTPLPTDTLSIPKIKTELSPASPLSEGVIQIKIKRVELILEGEFSEFTSNRQQDIVGVLATLLKIDQSNIRILNVYQGSIVIIMEVPDTAANYLYELASTQDLRIMNLGVKSVLVEDREIIERAQKTVMTLGNKPEQLRRVLLTGMAGIGKTALAATLSDQRLQQNKGVVIWLKAGDDEVDSLMDALADATGDRKPYDEARGDNRILLLRSLLEKMSASLLVFDDVRNIAAIEKTLHAIPDNLPVLITSRRHFDVHEIVDIEQLEPSQALALLESSAGKKHKEYSKDSDAVKLCEELGYHPLALELSASNMRLQKRTPSELRRRFSSDPLNLSKPGHGGLRTLLEDSISVLNEKTRKVFQAFGAFFENGLTSTLLKTYLDMPIADLDASLDELVDYSLIKRRPETEFYYMHDLISIFACSLFDSSGANKTATVKAILDYLPEHAKHFDLIALDIPNLLGAARNSGPLELVKIISYLTIGNYPLQEGKSYADQRGYSIGLIEQLDRAIEAARSLGAKLKPTTHYLLGKRGNAAFQRGEYELAAEKYREELLLSLNDERRVIAGSILARTLAHCGRIEESRRYFETASQLADELNDDALRGFVLEQESWAAGYVKDFEYERQVANKQMAIAEVHYKQNPKVDTAEGLFYALLNLGVAELELAKQGRGDFKTASKIHEKALDLAEKIKSELLLAYALTNLGEEYHYLGKQNRAISTLRRAHELWRSLSMSNNEKYVEELMHELNYPSLKPEEEQDEPES
jgi:tetratricopeptide (TPR) repeat protein